MGKNVIVWIAILFIGTYWVRKRYFSCNLLWSKYDNSTKVIFFETLNKVDNNSALKQRIEDEAINQSRSYESQKVYYATQYLVEENKITDIQRRNIIKCLA